MNSPQPLFSQQSSQSGGEVTAIAPGARATFLLSNFPTLVNKLWPYIQAVHVTFRFAVLNQGEGSRIIMPDEFWKLIQSFSLRTQDLGQIYSKQITRGPWFGYLAQIISNGYRLPYKYTQPIQNNGVAATREVTLRIPIGHRVLLKGHQTAPWSGFMKDGKLEVDLAAANVFGVGATVQGNVSLSCAVEYTVEPEARIHTMWVHRMYESQPNARLHSIKQVGGGDGLNGVKPGCRLAAFAFLAQSDGAASPTGLTSSFLGMGGSTTVDDIVSVEYPGRNQESLQIGSLLNTGVGNIFARELDNRKSSLVDPEGLWPIDLALNGGAIVDAQNPGQAALFYMAPSLNQEVTKLQKHYGDIQINHEYANGTPVGTPLWYSMEGYEYQEKQKEFFRERMGIASGTKWYKKLATGDAVSESKGEVLPDKFDIAPPGASS